MIVSRNELRSITAKAMVGSGFDTGRATEVARACVWLHERDHSGAAAVLHSLALVTAADRSTTDRPALHRTVVGSDTATWTCGRTSAVLDGAAALDLLLSTVADRLLLHQVDSPLLLVGLVGSTSTRRGGGVALAPVHDDVAGEATVIEQTVPGDACAVVGRDCSVQLTRTTPSPTDLNLPVRVSGIEIAEAHWDALCDLANLTTVPSTSGSRSHGAGAGLTDND